LSNHQDRSSKNLLRGTDGVLVGWKCHPDEPQHSGGTRVLKHFPTVYVRFPNANWTLEGLDAQDPDNRGVYALTSMKAAWHLVPAHNNKPAMLKIMRQQIPICPAFARTAYSVQGMTLLAAVVDLCYDVIRFASTAILNAYIALSRVREADDVLILRPFPRDVFTVGVPKSKLVLSKYMQAEIEVIECADPDCDGSVEGATCEPCKIERELRVEAYAAALWESEGGESATTETTKGPGSGSNKGHKETKSPVKAASSKANAAVAAAASSPRKAASSKANAAASRPVPEKCRCGSTSHKRTNHDDCPLNVKRKGR
jgi:hypothetical protein